MFSTRAGLELLLGGGLVASNVMLWARIDRQASADAASLASEPVVAVTAKATGNMLDVPAPGARPGPELAPFMSELEQLTHKLQLAELANHRELVEFYLYESREVAKQIVSEVPGYGGHAIAILVDRMLEPAYARLEAVLKQRRRATR